MVTTSTNRNILRNHQRHTTPVKRFVLDRQRLFGNIPKQILFLSVSEWFLQDASPLQHAIVELYIRSMSVVVILVSVRSSGLLACLVGCTCVLACWSKLPKILFARTIALLLDFVLPCVFHWVRECVWVLNLVVVLRTCLPMTAHE